MYAIVREQARSYRKRFEGESFLKKRQPSKTAGDKRIVVSIRASQSNAS